MTDYEVFKDICESTLIGYKSQLKRYDAKEVADIIFLYFIALQILKSSFYSAPFAISYSNETINSSFDNFKQSGTDLHVLIHVLFGKNNTTFELLNNQKASIILKDKMSFNTSAARRWLSNMINVDESTDSQFLLKIENGLKIDNSSYRSMRRLAGEWTSLDQSARQLVMTRLIQAFKSAAPKSELLPSLIKLGKQEKLIIKGANNVEQSSGSKNVLKAIGLGALATTGVAAYALARTMKNIGKHKEGVKENLEDLDK